MVDTKEPNKRLKIYKTKLNLGNIKSCNDFAYLKKLCPLSQTRKDYVKNPHSKKPFSQRQKRIEMNIMISQSCDLKLCF